MLFSSGPHYKINLLIVSASIHTIPAKCEAYRGVQINDLEI
jgi:hypothetical protein